MLRIKTAQEFRIVTQNLDSWVHWGKWEEANVLIFHYLVSICISINKPTQALVFKVNPSERKKKITFSVMGVKKE